MNKQKREIVTAKGGKSTET